ncbi:MAG: LacI family DNA-binding transcriptional regulator [Limnochordia bacterium]|jgi:LacI family transcriptional regulator|nr:LacI family transcriptional regulator [Limnochordia bacterium]MDD2629346.1 LacI family DNA-binding transcriptional regulator [Limnochordia bacterium]MDD4518023.1 LacI family DNA-binding transcriptional regulator [Limnochordia bacterium]
MATIREVAALAGVSTTTVSRVLNAKGSQIPISDRTKKKVIAAAIELGYEPNYMAKGLVGCKTETIGLVMYDLAHVLHPNFSQIVHGIVSALSQSSFDLMLLPLKGKLKRRNPIPFSVASYYRQHRVDGMIIAAQEVSTKALLELHREECPFVLLGAHLPGTKLPSVRANVEQGISDLIEHLFSLGHRRIGFINGPEGFRINDEMALGYRKALCRKGLFDTALLRSSDFTSETTRKRTKELLQLHEPPTAIMAADDLMAIEIMNVITEAGLTVPGDVSVAGYADLSVSGNVTPLLTTVGIPISETGRRAALLLLEILDKNNVRQPVQVLPTELIVRESTGPVSRWEGNRVLADLS